MRRAIAGIFVWSTTIRDLQKANPRRPRDNLGWLCYNLAPATSSQAHDDSWHQYLRQTMQDEVRITLLQVQDVQALTRLTQPLSSLRSPASPSTGCYAIIGAPLPSSGLPTVRYMVYNGIQNERQIIIRWCVCVGVCRCVCVRVRMRARGATMYYAKRYLLLQVAASSPRGYVRGFSM